MKPALLSQLLSHRSSRNCGQALANFFDVLRLSSRDAAVIRSEAQIREDGSDHFRVNGWERRWKSKPHMSQKAFEGKGRFTLETARGD